MQRAVEKMAADGYEVHMQSGEFSRTLFTSVWARRKVVVTFRLQNDENRPPRTS